MPLTVEQNNTLSHAAIIYADATGLTVAGARKLLDDEPHRLMSIVAGLEVINSTFDDGSPLADEIRALVSEADRLPVEVVVDDGADRKFVVTRPLRTAAEQKAFEEAAQRDSEITVNAEEGVKLVDEPSKAGDAR